MLRSTLCVKNTDIINPLPEVNIENVQKYILNARFKSGADENQSVFGFIQIQTAHGEEVCGCFIGFAASVFGLEDPTLTELKAAAHVFLEKVSNANEAAA